jgi:hypothetical protein
MILHQHHRHIKNSLYPLTKRLSTSCLPITEQRPVETRHHIFDNALDAEVKDLWLLRSRREDSVKCEAVLFWAGCWSSEGE